MTVIRYEPWALVSRLQKEVDRVLTIHGQREATLKNSREGYRRVERHTGEFQRRFSLPETADAQNIKAKAVNGVLEVSIPKVAQVQPQRITVEAA